MKPHAYAWGMDREPIDISVVIPCRNEEGFIEKTIRRIVSQEGAGKDYNMEIIIVDGRSSDRTLAKIENAVREDNRIKCIINEKKITPAGLNLGIKNASGRYISLIVAHTYIEKDYLNSCLEAINKTTFDTVGGPCIAKGTGYIAKAIALGFQSPFSCGNAKSHRANYEGYTDTVSNGFYKKEVFDRIGLFDEDLIRDHDDELHYRLIKSGGRIWQTPHIRYTYVCRDTVKRLFLQYMQYGYWKVRVIQKHKRPTSMRHLVPAAFVGAAPFFPGLILLYTALNLTVSIFTCLKNRGIKFLPVMPVVFAAFHIGYGIGFLNGIADFIILKREKRKIKDAPLTK